MRLKAVARYERRGLPALEVVGEEWFHFAGDCIERHVDQVLNLDEVMGTWCGTARHCDHSLPRAQPPDPSPDHGAVGASDPQSSRSRASRPQLQR